MFKVDRITITKAKINGKWWDLYRCGCRRVYKFTVDGKDYVLKADYLYNPRYVLRNQCISETNMYCKILEEDKKYFSSIIGSGMSYKRVKLFFKKTVPYVIHEYIEGESISGGLEYPEEIISVISKYNLKDIHGENILMTSDGYKIIDYAV